MESGQNMSYLVALGAGFLVFLSPCIFPLIPTYLSYLTGVSFKDISSTLTTEERRRIQMTTVIHSLMFVIGFSIVFMLLGTTASALGRVLLVYQDIIKKVSAVLIILFGLFISGIFRLSFLEQEKKIEYKKKGVSYLGSLIVGATFAFAWTPCVGPTLGAILAYTSSEADMIRGIKLLGMFSLGVAIPFVVGAFFINSLLTYVNRLKNYIRWVNIVGGVVLVIFGILILIGGIR